MKFILLTILIYFSFTVVSNSDDATKKERKRNFKSLIFISAGMPFSTGSPNFFSIYNNEFAGFKKDIKTEPAIGGGTKIRFEGNYRIGAQFRYIHSTLKDYYDQEVKTKDVTGYRNLGQSISISDIPIIGTIEYMPFIGQFRTYTGAGVGFLMRKIEWLESVRTSIPLDYRVGGQHYNDTQIYPAFSIYTGVELGFDKMNELTFLGSLVIEASYNYNAAQTDLFRTVKRQFVPENAKLNETVNILPGYFMLSLGITFNFNQ